MSAPTTLSVSRVLSALGLKGGRVPSMGLDTYQPVVIMADFSRTLASEPIEARAVAAGALVVIGGQRAHFQIQSVAGGGIILDHLRIRTAESPATNLELWFQVSADPLIAGAAVPHMDIGGRKTGSRVTGLAALGAVPAGYLNVMVRGTSIELIDLRWYLAPGHFLEIINNVTGEDLHLYVNWRELDEPIGAP